MDETIYLMNGRHTTIGEDKIQIDHYGWLSSKETKRMILGWDEFESYWIELGERLLGRSFQYSHAMDRRE